MSEPLFPYLGRWSVNLLCFLIDRERMPAYLALAAGALAVRGLPPLQEELSMMVGFSLFFLLLFRASSRQGAWLGFLFGLSHFSLGFSWLITSIHTHGGFPYPVALLTLFFFSAVIALYPALFGALLPRLAPRPEVLPLVAPALWVVTEWLRTHLFTGFSWNLAGYGWNGRQLILQIADLGGIYLLSWLMIFPAAVFSLLWIRRRDARLLVIGLGGLVILMAGVVLYGSVRQSQGNKNEESLVWAPPLRVAMVQGNIPQHLKWDPRFKSDSFSRYLSLSRAANGSVDLVVWPETAVAFFLQSSPEAMDQISQLSRELGAPILTGTPMADKDDQGTWHFYNSALLLNEQGSLQRRYDKRHLVPFGEYVPLRDLLPYTLSKLTAGTSDFAPGLGPIPLAWSQGALGVLICYEAIFPEEVRQLALTGPRWLINVTNDAWFGETAKPQHLAMVRLRAIENRLPLIRVANTGLSAAFDQYGRELGRIDANKTGVLVVNVPRGSGQSLFRHGGQAWIWFWLYLSLAARLAGLWQGRSRSRKTDH